MFRSFLAATLALAFAAMAHPSIAQTVNGRVVTSCGSIAYSNGESRPVTQDITGLICTTSGGGGGGSVTQGTSPWVVGGAAANGSAFSGPPVPAGADVNTTLPTLADGQRGTLQLDTKGNLRSLGVLNTTTSSDAFSNSVGYATVFSSSGSLALPVTGGYVFNGATWDRLRGNTLGVFVSQRPQTTGGLTPCRIVTGTANFCKASAGLAYKLVAVNTNAALRYLHLYNKASAPTLSTDTPIMTIPLQTNVTVNIDLTEIGLTFATGIAWSYTTDDIAIPATAGTSTELHATILYN